MKTRSFILIIVTLFALANGCSNSSNKKSAGKNDTKNIANAPDTGYNGITQYFSTGRLVKEVTFKNGIRQGLMKTFYPSGKLYQTFWYENGKRQDTAIMFFEDGKIFRKTAFKDDSMHGTQIQYYKSGRVRARLQFVNGLRTPYLEEFDANGSKYSKYPDLVVKTRDEYSKNGSYIISLEVSQKNVKANFYRGEYINGLFNPKKCIKVNITEATGIINLKKSDKAGSNYVGIIAEIVTPLGNHNLVYKKVDLPYSNLK